MFFQGVEFTPFVHSTGNAARIARLGVPIPRLDLLERESLTDLLAGHDVVVNCALGDGAAMLQGFRNLTSAMVRLKTRRFIHLSSTAIYGEEPAPDTVTEEGSPNPQGNAYAILKLRQDEAVFRLNSRGVPSWILCPVNIVGPYSLFTIGLVEALKNTVMPLVDEGAAPSNLVHVDNLVEAILVAARGSEGAGERYFVNETRPVSWREALEDHARLVGVQPRFIHVKREQVLPYLLGRQLKTSLKDQGKVLISGEFRRAVSRLPVLAKANDLAGTVFSKLPDGLRLGIREKLQWPLKFNLPKSDLDVNSRFARVQIRNQYHSPQKLANQLGWTPPLDYREGLKNTAEWLEFAGLMNS